MCYANRREVGRIQARRRFLMTLDVSSRLVGVILSMVKPVKSMKKGLGTVVKAVDVPVDFTPHAAGMLASRHSGVPDQVLQLCRCFVVLTAARAIFCWSFSY